MTLQAFNESVKEKQEPPVGLGLALQALWWDAKGDWDKAHQRAQEETAPEGSWVHAYLHRVEGDQSNAAYWYRRAGKPVAACPLPQERNEIAAALLRPRTD